MSRQRGYTHGPHLFRRGRIWYSRVPGAERAEVSLRTDDRAEAEKLHAARVNAVIEGADGVEGRSALKATANAPADLVTLADQFLTAEHDWTPRSARSARHRVLAFCRWCARQSPAVETTGDLTDAVVDAWIRARREATTRQGTPTSSTTISRDFKMVRRWLRWCAELHLCAETPFTRRRAPKEPTRAPDPQLPHPRDVGKVARWLARHDQKAGALAAEVLVATGMRRGELRTLPLENVSDYEVKAPPGKGRRERVVPVDPRVAKAARAFIALRDARSGRDARLDDHWSRDVIAPACEAVKVERFGAHDLRRVFATVAFRGGVPLQDVQRFLGHISATTTQRYIGRLRGELPRASPLPPELSIARPARKAARRASSSIAKRRKGKR